MSDKPVKTVEYRVEYVENEEEYESTDERYEAYNSEQCKLFFEKIEAEGIQPAFQVNGIDAFPFTDGLYISTFTIERENASIASLLQDWPDNFIIRLMLIITSKYKETAYIIFNAPKPSTESVRVKSTDFPIDKVNGTVWGLLENTMKRTEDGQIALYPIPVQKTGSKTPVFVQYAVSFDDLEKNNPGISFTRRLTPYEKRVYIAAGALWNVKKRQPFTYSELYAAAGYVGRPGGNDTDKLDAALTKMNGTRIFVDNAEESGTYHYPHFRYDGSLLPMERVSIIENGKPVDAAISLFREPPFISYAKEHKQITTISIKLLQSPLSKTDANIQLEDYLIERIARAKNERQKWGKKRCRTQEDREEKEKALAKDLRILLSTLYEKTGVTTKKQRQRAPERIRKLLDHYKAEKFISEYSIDDTAITIVTA